MRNTLLFAAAMIYDKRVRIVPLRSTRRTDIIAVTVLCERDSGDIIESFASRNVGQFAPE